MSARMRHFIVSILAVSGSQGARLRGSSGSTGPRGKEIYCQTGGASGAGIWAHTFPTHIETLFTFASRSLPLTEGLFIVKCHMAKADRLP